MKTFILGKNKRDKKQHQKDSLKPKGKRVASLLARLAVGIVVVLALVLAPTIYVTGQNLVNKRFSQKMAGYQGVVELWNIDSFEGGTSSKSGFLQARATEYQNANKGFYILVRNMTETECLLALADGQRPAMFSFGVGVASELQEYLASITLQKNSLVRQDFLASGMVGNSTYALPWCRGVYSLISTQANLANIGLDGSALGDVALSCGYTKALSGGKTKTVYSLAFGGGGYTSPQLAYASNFGTLVQTDTSYSSDFGTKTAYDAYCDFIEGKASVLLGTQRDIARVENRVSQGRIQDVVYQHITNYTDLVQYIAICNSASSQLQSQCNDFANFLVSDNVQQQLSKIGMFAVANVSSPLYSTGEWVNIEQLCQASCQVQNLFYTKDQIAATRLQYMQIISA